MDLRKLTLQISASLSLLALAAATQASTVWNETIHGDLSGDFANPTDVVLSSGQNSVFNTFGRLESGELEQDYIHVHIPAGRKLTNLFVRSFVGEDGHAFIAMQEGAAMTFHADDAFAHIDEILGLAHFGPGVGDTPPNADILPRMGTEGPNVFVPPMPGRDYSFWVQQLFGLNTIQLDFTVSNLVPGDFNLDGARTSADIRAMLIALTDLDKFAFDSGLTAGDLLAIGDLDGVGGVTNKDLQPLLNLIATSGGGSISAVPEPCAIALAVLGGIAMLLRPRRRSAF